MNILLIGSGGREHCMAWKMAQSPLCSKLYIAPGNAGSAQVGENVDLALKAPFDAVKDFVTNHQIELVAVGPEAPLVDGLADALIDAGVKVFGPRKGAALLEGSKDFAKQLMQDAGVPTGAYATFDNRADAEAYIDANAAPYVLKYDGLAAGKGVSIHPDADDAKAQLKAIFEDNIFGDDAPRVVVEEFLTGQEASMLAFVDGKTVRRMEAAQDHKQIGEGDTGPNTGGMGAYSPTPVVDEAMAERIDREILQPVVAEFQRRNLPYVGVLYAGLMVGDDGPKVIEFNVRFGDPETQCVLPRLKSDLVEVMLACCEGRLDQITLEWDSRTAIGVVAASAGYPGSYAKGKVIAGVDAVGESDEHMVFHAGVASQNSELVTSGGRVLCVTALGDGLRDAQSKCYALMDKIEFEGKTIRRDIGNRVLG
ncbi:phosphoribosylamine--glycine ligase [Candidatus Sumerlaeota bacterium]|nr:phosphoribosylamine--glycine ligase [Candidatus Sumerlaeota bacterium]